MKYLSLFGGLPFTRLIGLIFIGLCECKPQVTSLNFPGPSPELPNESLTFTQIQLNRKGNLYNSVSLNRKAWPNGWSGQSQSANTALNPGSGSTPGNTPGQNIIFGINSENIPNSANKGQSLSRAIQRTIGSSQNGFTVNPDGGVTIHLNSNPVNAVPLCPGFPFCDGNPFCPGFPFCNSNGMQFCPGFPFCKATATDMTNKSENQRTINSQPVAPPSKVLDNFFRTIEQSIPPPSPPVVNAIGQERNKILPYADPNLNSIKRK